MKSISTSSRSWMDGRMDDELKEGVIPRENEDGMDEDMENYSESQYRLGRKSFVGSVSYYQVR